jgi:hypothetical protein
MRRLHEASDTFWNLFIPIAILLIFVGIIAGVWITGPTAAALCVTAIVLLILGMFYSLLRTM